MIKDNHQWTQTRIAWLKGDSGWKPVECVNTDKKFKRVSDQSFFAFVFQLCPDQILQSIVIFSSVKSEVF